MNKRRALFRTYLACVILAAQFAARSEARIDPKTISGLWLFDDTPKKTAKDDSGNGYDGELKGAPSWVAGKFGTALEFHGADYVELQKSAEGLPFGASEPFTISAWVNVRGGGTVIGKFNGGVIGAYILVVEGGGNVVFHREVAPWGLSGASVRAGEFQHVAAVYDGAEMRIYVNGKVAVKQVRGPQNTDRVTPVLIAARYTGGKPSNFFDGVLDEVALFNVALTEGQIAEAMKGLSPNFAVSPSRKTSAIWGKLKTILRAGG